MSKRTIGVLGVVVGITIAIVFRWALPPHVGVLGITHKIIMPDTEWIDTGNYLSFGGSIVGEGYGGLPNFFGAECTKDSMRCETVDFAQVGENQIGDVDRASIAISTWNDGLIVVQDEVAPTDCTKLTINVDRQNRKVEYVKEPVNQANILCEQADQKLERWRVEDPPTWRQPDVSFHMHN